MKNLGLLTVLLLVSACTSKAPTAGADYNAIIGTPTAADLAYQKSLAGKGGFVMKDGKMVLINTEPMRKF